MLNPSKRGEIATLLTIGAVIVLGISTFVSSIFVKNTQTTSSKASTGVCRDNPEAPPAGYTWKADCARSCSSNADCPKNTSSGYVDASSSNWCYGFESGFRCLQLQYGGGGGSTGSQPGGTSGGSTGSGTNNGCFTLSAEFEPKKEGDKWAFYAWVRFSGSQTGDVQLMYNGTHVAGWNRKSGADDFVYDPSWTQPYSPGTYVAVATMSPGQSITASYQGFLSGCTPQDITVSCTLNATALGASVSGTGCVCRGCSSGSTGTTQPTVAPTAPSTSTGSNASPTPKRIPTDVPASIPTPAPTFVSGNCATVGTLDCYKGNNLDYIKTCESDHFWRYVPCADKETCTKSGSTARCISPTPTFTPTPTPTEKPGLISTPIEIPNVVLTPSTSEAGQLGQKCIARNFLLATYYSCNEGLVCNKSLNRCVYSTNPTATPTPTPVEQNKFTVINGYANGSDGSKTNIKILLVRFSDGKDSRGSPVIRLPLSYDVDIELKQNEQSRYDYSEMCKGNIETMKVTVYFSLIYIEQDGSSRELLPMQLEDEVRCNGEKGETLLIEAFG